MPIENRSVRCDVCLTTQVEKSFNSGWPGWVQIQGIGSTGLGPDETLESKHLETWLCPTCKKPVSNFINTMQGESQ